VARLEEFQGLFRRDVSAATAAADIPLDIANSSTDSETQFRLALTARHQIRDQGRPLLARSFCCRAAKAASIFVSSPRSGISAQGVFCGSVTIWHSAITSHCGAAGGSSDTSDAMKPNEAARKMTRQVEADGVKTWMG